MRFFECNNGFLDDFENGLWVVILIAFRYGDYFNFCNSSCCGRRKGSVHQDLDQTRALDSPYLKAESALLIDTAKNDTMIYK